VTDTLSPEEAASIRRLCTRLLAACGKCSPDEPEAPVFLERSAPAAGDTVVGIPSLSHYGGPKRVMGRVLTNAIRSPWEYQPTVYAVAVGEVLRWVDGAMELTEGAAQ
jgi:hypothetical protein